LITFGLRLDGEQGWRPGNRLGEPVYGPLGLLDLLETRLGLLRPGCAHAQRVAQYRECLHRHDGQDRFYHASFAVDPIGTAATLLSWRDDWHLHGWNGGSLTKADARLNDMAAVETRAREMLFPSIGERLARVADALNGQQADIERIELVDPLPAFPKQWREVLANLLVRPVKARAPSAAPDTMLGQLQGALAAAHAGTRPQGKIAWSDDGSLRVVRAETGLLAARWVADLLAAAQPENIAIVAEHARSLLDATLDGADVARQGLQDPSPLAPALQVLPLALATTWQPLDVHALLQFLSHPIGPIPGYARRRLAEVVAQSPGIGGPRWTEAVRKIIEVKPEGANELPAALAFWFGRPRFDPGAGAPLPALLETTRAIGEHFVARLKHPNPNRRAAAATGLAQATAVTAALEALAAQGEATLPRAGLDALVAQCTGRGAANSAMHAEVGGVAAVSDPAALVEAFDQVIWWQMGAPALPGHYPWSRSEIVSLSAAGVELPTLDALLRQRGEDWLRPVLNARQQLVLVLPSPGEEVHPLWQQIEWLFEGLRPEPLEGLLTGRIRCDLPEIEHAALRVKTRWWQLPQDVRIAARDVESYSSLGAFLDAPHRWVLRYAAGIKPSSLRAVADANLLYGNLAHRLIERLFQGGDARVLRDEAWKASFAREFDSVVSEEGAVLLMRGRRGDHERLRSSLERAIGELRRQLAAAGVGAVEPERALTGSFTGGIVAGVADLVVHGRDGGRAIIDMKWSGGKSHEERLATNRHLQLAIYAELLRQEMGAWPTVSYFILDAARLVAPDTGFFPQARAVSQRAPGSTAALWDRFGTAWRWRREQLDAGRIEVATKGAEPTPESAAPPDALEPEELNEDYDDYRWLTGWEG
jgi:hypothetical protein